LLTSPAAQKKDKGKKRSKEEKEGISPGHLLIFIPSSSTLGGGEGGKVKKKGDSTPGLRTAPVVSAKEENVRGRKRGRAGAAFFRPSLFLSGKRGKNIEKKRGGPIIVFTTWIKNKKRKGERKERRSIPFPSEKKGGKRGKRGKGEQDLSLSMGVVGGN